jgi:hypothetical protein
MEPDLFGGGNRKNRLDLPLQQRLEKCSPNSCLESSHGSVFNLTFNSFHSRAIRTDGTASLDRPELLRAHVLLAGAVGAQQTHTLVVRRLRLARGGLK